MKQWIARLNSHIQISETLTREVRREIILRFVIWFTLLVLAILTPFRVIDWVNSPTQHTLFYFINSVVCILLLLIIARLNDIHQIKKASYLYLLLSYYLCFSAYPLQNPDQVLLYLTIPSMIASFVSEENKSLWFTGFAAFSYLCVFKFIFPYAPYPIFSATCLVLVAIISWLVSMTIEQMTGQLLSAYDKTIEGWSQALELRDKETEGHSQRVADLTMKLVKKMHVDETRWVHVRRGVLLHDIGKMGVPDTILCKAGPLTETEHKVMSNHPLYAKELLEKIPYLAPAIEIPYCHHEKWDGSGYPRGLNGNEIPLEARIFSVIDVWDAMRSKRSYRDEIAENQVVEYLNTESGRSFDPAVVKEFFDLMNFKIPVTHDLPLLILSQKPQRLNQ